MVTAPSSTLEEKIHDLCEAIATDPKVRSARATAEAFFADETAVSTYRDLMRRGQALEEKGESGRLTEADRKALEKVQETMESDDGIRGFSEAQHTLQDVANTVNAFVTKTLEKGRVPTEEEALGGSCGHGCGCH